MPSEVVLQVEGLKKYFSDRSSGFFRPTNVIKAVDDISFIIKKKEIFALVGESGCGKSTTGRTILNLLDPTGGRVVFDGQTLFDQENGEKLSSSAMRKLRKNMQMIFQDPYASLDPRMNIASILTEGTLKHRIYTPQQAIEHGMQLMELCGLDSSGLEKYPHEFSGGQRQRIGIARALSLNPKLIVADEPLAALDVSIQAQILLLMQEIKEKSDLTYLFISHDLGVVRYFCDRVGIMYLGAFAEIGDSADIFENPHHPYTKALLSAIPKSSPKEVKQRIVLAGETPSPANPPKGCKFHTRCPYVMAVCKSQSPIATQVEPNHTVFCHLYDL